MRGNERLLGEAIGRGREWGMRAEEVRGVWPFKDGL